MCHFEKKCPTSTTFRATILRLMIYIVALTTIMQNVFVIMTSTNNFVVSRHLVKVVLKVFLESSQKEIIYSIKRYVGNPVKYGGNAMLQKIAELIKSERNRISSEDIAKIKTLLENSEPEDEPW